jgi:hypothetical protein
MIVWIIAGSILLFVISKIISAAFKLVIYVLIAASLGYGIYLYSKNNEVYDAKIAEYQTKANEILSSQKTFNENKKLLYPSYSRYLKEPTKGGDNVTEDEIIDITTKYPEVKNIAGMNELNNLALRIKQFQTAKQSALDELNKVKEILPFKQLPQ